MLSIRRRCVHPRARNTRLSISIYVTPRLWDVICHDTPLSSPTSTNIGFGGLKSDTESEIRVSRQRVLNSRIRSTRRRFQFRGFLSIQDLERTCNTPYSPYSRTRSSLACLPRLFARSHASSSVPRSQGRELTFTNAHARREDNCCGVTPHDEVAHNPPPSSRRRSAMSMCNNPYRHGWLPLLGLHNRALIDNLYGACRLFDYPPPAGRRLGCGATRLLFALLLSSLSVFRLSILLRPCSVSSSSYLFSSLFLYLLLSWQK